MIDFICCLVCGSYLLLNSCRKLGLVTLFPNHVWIQLVSRIISRKGCQYYPNNPHNNGERSQKMINSIGCLVCGSCFLFLNSLNAYGLLLAKNTCRIKLEQNVIDSCC